MRLAEAVDIIEGCGSLEELKVKFQMIVENYGFSTYAFVDIGDPSLDEPFAIPAGDQKWVVEYRSNQFVHVDPILPIVRRTNIPFSWSQVAVPRTGKRKSGAYRTMEAARDHGFQDGLVIPFHFVDKIGRVNSASCVLFWKDKRAAFLSRLRYHKSDFHILTIYWAQQVIGLVANEAKRQRIAAPDTFALTDREREVLTWAARGKTMVETGAILRISDETVETHVRNAMQKLQTVNKTQAVVRAIKLGLIDV